MTAQKTKQERIDEAWEKYVKIRNESYENKDKALREFEKVTSLAWEEYERKRDEIESEPEEVEGIIEYKGRKYKLIEEEK